MNFTKIFVLGMLLNFSTFTMAMVGGSLVGREDPLAKSTVLLWLGEQNRCTGVILSKNIILSAAHCAFKPRNKYKVLFAQSLREALESNSSPIYRTVKNIIVNPKFREHDSLSDDLALFILNDPIPDGYKAARLPEAVGEYSDGQILTTLGFGLENIMAIPFPNEEIEMKKNTFVSSDPGSLNADIDFRYHRFFFKQPKGGICVGDSGGPVFLNGDSASPLLIAVNGGIYGGGGTACADSAYFSRLDYSLDWIQAEIAAAGLPSN